MIRPVSRYAGALGKKGWRLPKDLLTSRGSQYEAFENDADWTLYSGGSKESNTDQVHEGAASEKFTSRSGAQTWIRKTVAWDLSAAERLGLWVYVHDLEAIYHTTDGLCIYLQTSATLVDYYKLKMQGAYMNEQGWHYFASPLARASTGGAPDWASIIRITFEIYPAAGQVVSLSLDDLWMNHRGVPAIMFYFDDGYATHYSVAFDHLQEHAIRATLACQTDLVGDAGYVTVAQIQEMAAAGWTIANHTNSGSALAGQAEAAQEAQLQGGYDDLVSWGLSKGAKLVVYPSGEYDATTLALMASMGMLVGRTVEPTIIRPLVLPVSHPYKIECSAINDTITLETAQGYVDQAIEEKSILAVMFHNIAGAPNWTEADFDSFVDYVATKAAAKEIYPITLHDYYRLTLQGIRIPKVIA